MTLQEFCKKHGLVLDAAQDIVTGNWMADFRNASVVTFHAPPRCAKTREEAERVLWEKLCDPANCFWILKYDECGDMCDLLEIPHEGEGA